MFFPISKLRNGCHSKKKNVYKETLSMDLLASLPRVKTVKRGQVKANLERLQKKFNEVSDENGNVQMEQFKMIMNCKNVSELFGKRMALISNRPLSSSHTQDLFLDRLFAIFDKDSSGVVSKKEFLETINEVIVKPDGKAFRCRFEISIMI